MSRIVQSSNGNCAQRAISVMRLALGYESGLPEEVQFTDENGKTLIPKVISIVGKCFPRHVVKVWASKTNRSRTSISDNVLYMEDVILDEHIDFDAHLTAFGYAPRGDNTRGHLVIGDPVIYDADSMEIVLVISVALSETD